MECCHQVWEALSSAPFTDKETDTQTCHFPKVTQLVSVRDRIHTQDCVGRVWALDHHTALPPCQALREPCPSPLALLFLLSFQV